MCKVFMADLFILHILFDDLEISFLNPPPPPKKTPQSVRCYLLQWKWSLLKDVSQYKFLL